MLIRPERPSDLPGIRGLNLAAFDGPLEAALVDALREKAAPIVSLVAEDAAGAGDASPTVGHILFSPATLDADPALPVMGLAPMAVAAARRGEGIGSALVRHGLERCRRLGCAAVIVLGHADYYPRFGFRPASSWSLRPEYDVPDDVFMAVELLPGVLSGKSGLVRYHPAFAGAEAGA